MSLAAKGSWRPNVQLLTEPPHVGGTACGSLALKPVNFEGASTEGALMRPAPLDGQVVAADKVPLSSGVSTAKAGRLSRDGY